VVSVTNRTSRQSVQSPEDELGQVVAGHYNVDLDHLLGQGGMALVYLGRDLRTRREVALKTLRLEYRHDPETRARFRREARTMAFLKHPNVARVYDLYEDADGPWAVLEYVPGRSLKEIIHEDGPLDPGWTSSVLDQVANALSHLHAHGLVHLDVKPQNLLMTSDGTVKLIDFGLAQAAGAKQESIGGSTFGTAAYLAPEQACGEPVDVATDVYALGCVVYELLTGRPPFEPTGEKELKNEIIRAHLEQMPAAPTVVRPDLRLPAWVDDTVLWALAKQPQDRYHDVQTFAQMFRSGLEQTAPIVTGVDAHLTAGIIDTVPVWAPESHPVRVRPSVSRRAAAGLYRAGGRAARRSTRFRRSMWRLVGALVVANVMLAAITWYDRGELPGLGASGHLEPGAKANVVVNDLNVRANPGRDGAILGLVGPGNQVIITGESASAADETWWPVETTVDGQQLTGYVWDEGIEGKRSGLSGTIQAQIDRVKAIPSDVLDGAGL
jgi:tRNA A-37 threonylcarbamoyl transferase component Bud32